MLLINLDIFSPLSLFGKPCFVPIVGFLSLNILAQNLFDLLVLRHTNFLFCAALVFYLAESPCMRSFAVIELPHCHCEGPWGGHQLSCGAVELLLLWSCWAAGAGAGAELVARGELHPAPGTASNGSNTPLIWFCHPSSPQSGQRYTLFFKSIVAEQVS